MSMVENEEESEIKIDSKNDPEKIQVVPKCFKFIGTLENLIKMNKIDGLQRVTLDNLFIFRPNLIENSEITQDKSKEDLEIYENSVKEMLNIFMEISGNILKPTDHTKIEKEMLKTLYERFNPKNNFEIYDNRWIEVEQGKTGIVLEKTKTEKKIDPKTFKETIVKTTKTQLLAVITSQYFLISNRDLVNMIVEYYTEKKYNLKNVNCEIYEFENGNFIFTTLTENKITFQGEDYYIGIIIRNGYDRRHQFTISSFLQRKENKIGIDMIVKNEISNEILKHININKDKINEMLKLQFERKFESDFLISYLESDKTKLLFKNGFEDLLDFLKKNQIITKKGIQKLYRISLKEQKKMIAKPLDKNLSLSLKEIYDTITHFASIDLIEHRKSEEKWGLIESVSNILPQIIKKN